MAVHTCPRCELRFRFRTELEWHLAEEHHLQWNPSDRNPSRPSQKAVPTPDRRQP
jgi:uncharacterized C2H2 Zn-finger protein